MAHQSVDNGQKDVDHDAVSLAQSLDSAHDVIDKLTHERTGSISRAFHLRSHRPEVKELSMALADADDWHLLPADQVAFRLDVQDIQNGLRSDEIASRREIFGSNRLSEGKRRSTLSIILSHFFSILTLVLGAVFVIAVVNEEWVEAVVVVLVILVNSSIGAWQETKSEKAMEAIRHLASNQTAEVIRDGESREIPIQDVVLGDVVVLRNGNQVPADIRLFQAIQLEADEAILTGESVPVTKSTAPVEPEHDDGDGGIVAVGDRVNMAFRQTGITQGSGRGIVVAVGPSSQIGKIAQRLAKRNGSSSKTPLTITMNRLFYMLFLIGLIFAVFIFWAFHWEGSSEALLYASATFVAILPEAAVVLITVTMAIGSRRMAQQNAIVRKLVALEQLGRVTDICSDKTGTLTLGSMRPARLMLFVPNDGEHCVQTLAVEGEAMSRRGVWLKQAGDPGSEIDLNQWCQEDSSHGRLDGLTNALQIAALCASTRLTIEEDGESLEGKGNPTEIALQEMVHKASHNMPDLKSKLWDAFEERGEWAFNSTVKRMSMGFLEKTTSRSATFTKGAPESVLSLCKNVNKHQQKRILDTAQSFARDGLRVLALSYRNDIDLTDRLLSDYSREEVEQDLNFVALVAIRDPPKPESKTAVAECGTAGITVRMLTGDHKDTAVAIAKEIGILPDISNFPRGMVLTGPQLDAMSEKELDELEVLPLVVARSSPDSKVKVVEALHRRNRVVAMTGDGVNDSPAIKEADVGIAMGVTGSEVTKGVADIVLADDNFATIVMAVREGRRIFDSISHFVMHLLSGNAAEAVLLLVSLAFLTDNNDDPIFVMGPLAILYLNTATGSGPAIGLALDEPAPDLMRRPPIRHSIFTPELICDFLVYGFIMGGLSLAGFALSFYVGLDGDASTAFNCNTESNDSCADIERARGATFLILHTLLLVHAYNCRHKRFPFWKLPLLKNKVLLWSLIIFTLLTLLWLYVPWLNTSVFKHGGIGWEWGLVVAMVVVFMIFVEIYKLLKRVILKTHVETTANAAPGSEHSFSVEEKLETSLSSRATAIKNSNLPLDESTLFSSAVPEVRYYTSEV